MPSMGSSATSPALFAAVGAPERGKPAVQAPRLRLPPSSGATVSADGVKMSVNGDKSLIMNTWSSQGLFQQMLRMHVEGKYPSVNLPIIDI